jgi:hypothetical protein
VFICNFAFPFDFTFRDIWNVYLRHISFDY